MTITEWRQSNDHRNTAIEVLKNPTLQQMLAMMDMEGPAKADHRIADGFGATITLGEIKGFQKAIDMLRSFAEPLPLIGREDVPITWNTEQPQT